ncbi:hypothetical protein SASPL_153680 [Salvia splendens]|uniref:Uncharacterized protein n=2 Tax=Salvia splendens TaxID=180675 RepID=A0A8X8VYT0_SALSN|nr:hypothetical protein SASPL_153680 [Salvia splendens]
MDAMLTDLMLYLGGSMSMMSNQRKQSDPVVGLRYRAGLSSGMPSVSRFRSGYMPTGLTSNVSESDMDTWSDSEGECYGTRYSPEASPQDDKLPNGGRGGYASGIGNFLDRQGGRGGGYSTTHRGFGEDDESSVCSEASSIPQPRHERGSVLEKKFKAATNFSGISSWSNVETSRESKIDGGIPSAPPFNGSSHINQVQDSRADAKPSLRTSGATEANTAEASVRASSVPSHPLPSKYPTFHASGLGYWYGVLSYDACVRLCLNSWSKGCMEAPAFLENECALLRDAFGLRNILLQSENELMKKQNAELVSEGASVKAKKTIGKIKIQVRRVRMGLDAPTGCAFASSLKSSSMVKLDSLQLRLSNMKTVLSAERKALQRERVTPVMRISGSKLQQSMTYIVVGTRQCLKEVPVLIKVGYGAWRSSSTSHEVVEESYTCLLKLKSSPEEDAVRMQPGSGETRVFLPDGLGDDLVIEVHDKKGKYCGNAVLQVADIVDESGEKLRSCYIYSEPEHEQVGKIQFSINYSTTLDENSHKCTSVAETIAYDCVLETAMKVQQFQQRNLLLNGSWKWLVNEFAAYFGVSDAYTKLRYLSYIMDVATPTADCLNLVHELLLPVVIKGKNKNTLSHQEGRILGEVSEEVEEMLTLLFESYKSLDESSPSGIAEVFGPSTGVAAPALTPALKLYKLLHDILSPEAQSKLCRYFQNAAKKRSRRHLSETDEFVSSSTDNILMDPLALSTAYRKMKSLCWNVRNEILTDIQIHKQDLLPSFVDLPNLSSSIYTTELFSRLKAFLVACPPAGPTPPVVELVMATSDFQRDLALWNISPVRGGFDAKELFHMYITRWIQEKRLALLEFCKFDKVKFSSLPTQHSTTSFVDDIYERIKGTLSEYDVIISRWPEYTFTLENAIAEVEKAVVESLEKQYVEVLSPLKENTMLPIKLGLKYVQKFAKGHGGPYNVTSDLGVVLNSMKRLLDVLRPQIEAQVKSWGSCIPESGNMAPGDCLSEVTVMIRSKFRAYVQAVVDKLVENMNLHNATKLKKIIQEAKDDVIESDLRQRMQPLKELVASTIDQLHGVFDTPVFINICRGFWDHTGQDILKLLADRKENKSWYKASRVAVSVLDDTFASQMQQLLGNALQEKDLEPPQRIMEVRSMLCKDAQNHKDNYLF